MCCLYFTCFNHFDKYWQLRLVCLHNLGLCISVFNTHSLYGVDCCDLWYVIRFAYITVVLDELVSQRESKRTVCWVKSMCFQVMDVVLLICGKGGQQGYGISCFKYVGSAGLLHGLFDIHWWCRYTVTHMSCAVFLLKARVGVCKLLQAGHSLSLHPMDCSVSLLVCTYGNYILSFAVLWNVVYKKNIEGKAATSHNKQFMYKNTL